MLKVKVYIICNDRKYYCNTNFKYSFRIKKYGGANGCNEFYINKLDKKENNQGLKWLIEGVKVSQQTKVS